MRTGKIRHQIHTGKAAVLLKAIHRIPLARKEEVTKLYPKELIAAPSCGVFYPASDSTYLLGRHFSQRTDHIYSHSNRQGTSVNPLDHWLACLSNKGSTLPPLTDSLCRVCLRICVYVTTQSTTQKIRYWPHPQCQGGRPQTK